MLEEGAARHGAGGRRSPAGGGPRALLAAATALRDTGRPVAARLAAASAARRHADAGAAPAARLRHRRATGCRCGSTASARCSASWYELFPRSEGAHVDPAPAQLVSGTFRTAMERLPAVRDMGFDVVYLPPIHPIGTHQPQGPEQHAHRRPGRRRVALGHRRRRRAGTTRSTPTSAPSTTSTPSSPGPRELGLEVALDLALQCSPDHPWVDGAPGVVHHARRRHDRLRREPAEEVPGHLPGQLRPRPRRASTPRCCGSCGYWMDHGVRIFRVDNPHTKPVAFWELADRRGPQDRPGRALPGRGVHPPGDDADARPGSASTSPTPTSPGATRSGS